MSTLATSTVATTAVILVGGFCSGVLASLLGVGGAVITTPLIRFLGATPIAAVGSTVPAIIPGAISGSLRYQREGYIAWSVALTCGLSGMAFAVLGGWVADIVDARWLMVATAMLLLWSGVSLLRDRQRRVPTAEGPARAGDTQNDSTENDITADPAGASTPPRTTPTAGMPAVTAVAPRPSTVRGGLPAVVGLGVLAGFLAGLLGIGGGIVLTPGLTLGLRLSVKQAIATSLVAVAMMSTTALLTHIALGHVDWQYALPLMVGVVPGARVGAHITVGASEHRMRLIAGSLLVAIALVFLATELAGLL